MYISVLIGKCSCTHRLTFWCFFLQQLLYTMHDISIKKVAGHAAIVMLLVTLQSHCLSGQARSQYSPEFQARGAMPCGAVMRITLTRGRPGDGAEY